MDFLDQYLPVNITNDSAPPPDSTYVLVAKISLVLELTLGTGAICVTGLCLAGYLKLHRWKIPSSLIVINLLCADLMNAVLSPFHAVLCEDELDSKNRTEFFRLVFFFQAMYLFVSIFTMLLMNISRLIAILAPFQYAFLITRRNITACLVAFWVGGLVMSFVRRFVSGTHTTFYLIVVATQFSLQFILLLLMILSLILLKKHTQTSDVQRRATLTIAAVSLAYILSYGYYIYVTIVWMIPGLISDTSNKWVQLTAVSHLSLTIAHLFLLLNNLFNGVMFGMQPEIRKAIQHVWVSDYYRSILISEQKEGRSL